MQLNPVDIKTICQHIYSFLMDQMVPQVKTQATNMAEARAQVITRSIKKFKYDGLQPA